MRRAVEDGKKILVFGDYDCDGITATVLLYEYLEGEGADVCYYIPERLNEGYGLSMQTMEMIISSGIELIITVVASLLYRRLLTERSWERAVGYAIVANVHSATVGLLLIDPLWRFIVSIS